jgi:hypothetical protein
MSRAINVSMNEAQVLAACAKQGAAVSASEPLPSGGTRVVLTSSEGAAAMRDVFAGEMLTGAVRRTPFDVRWPS